MARTPKLRHQRHSRYSRLRRNKSLIAWLAQVAAVITGTGTETTYTTDVVTGTCTFTLAGNVTQGKIVTIGDIVYTFRNVIESEKAVGTLTAVANCNAGDTVNIGGHVYTWVTQVEATAASGVLTLTVAPGEDETVTIGAKVYRFKAALAQANDVLIEATASDSIDNLVAAITGGAGSGVKYHAGTVAHTLVTAAAGAGDTMDVTAITAGVAGNAIALAETLTGDAWAGQTFLINGKDEEAADSVEKAGNASDSLDNLIAAISGGAGEGTVYGTGTVAHTTVDAVAGAGDTVTVSAKTAGTAGNSIATTVPVGAARMNFAAATLLGGEAVEPAYTVEKGATASDTLDNLIAAINGAAGAGTVYGTGTVAHTLVTAAAGAGDTMVVTARQGGAASASIVTTTDDPQGSWDHAVVFGGADSNVCSALAHGYNVGDGPFLLTTTGTLPEGLSADTLYYIHTRTSADKFTLCSHRGGTEVTIYTDGTGTNKLVKAASEEAVFELLKVLPREVIDAATDTDDLNG